MEVSTITGRIDAILKERGISKQEFYASCGISSAAYSQWNTGKTVPRAKSLQTIADYLNVNTEYLITGLGEKEKAPTQEGEREIGDEDLKAAFWGGEQDMSKEDWDEMWEDVQDFARFRVEQQRKKKNGVSN